MGICSARTRGAAKNQYSSNYNSKNTAPTNIDKPKPSKSWAACMKQLFEFDPLICPKCGGNMKIIRLRFEYEHNNNHGAATAGQESFITDSKQIKRIMQHHNLPDWRAPPAIKKKYLA